MLSHEERPTEIEVVGYGKSRMQLTDEIALLRDEIAKLKKRIVDLRSAAEKLRNGPEYFNERLDEEVARSNRYKYEFSILLVKMDNIQIFSKKCSEEETAETLELFEASLHHTLRCTDLICKLETALYGVILPYTDSEGGRIAARKLGQAVERIFSIKSSNSNVKLTLSGGVASYPKNAVTAEQLMMVGKEALTEAMTGGGNCICLAEESDASRELTTGKRPGLLYNDTFIQALNDEVGRCSRYSQQFSLVLVAITSLETRGIHLDGAVRTEIMRTAFKLLNTRIRTIDKSYLYTDTRFVVILPQTGTEGAVATAEKLIQSLICNPVLRNNEVEINIEVNAGITAFPADAVSGEGLLRGMEIALSQAILKGINKIELASNLVGGSKRNGKDINELIARIKETGPQSIYNLLASVDVTERYERSHSQFVARYSMVTGSMLGLSVNVVRRLRIMALLHDLGKVCLPETIIIKPGPLSDPEWDMMMQHPQYGADLLKQLPDFDFCYVPVLAHHERLDGKGYPKGLEGEQIPVESRIIAVVEAFDDMVTPRPYRQQVPPGEAIEELRNQSGRQFDDAVVKTFIRALSSFTGKV
ncbi:MAG: diguanylate cyclase [Dehalococcoidia bacterium]|nr:MAG: diguanylate cyclase [Dehalococcoidia bacterium]